MPHISSFNRIRIPETLAVPISPFEVVTADATTRVLKGVVPPTTVDPGLFIDDLYLDTKGGKIYSVQEDSTSSADPKPLIWVEGGRLGGGGEVLSGTGDPDPSLGTEGDMYYKTDQPQSIWNKIDNPAYDPVNDPSQPEFIWNKVMDLEGGGSAITFSDVPPTNPITDVKIRVGDLWWDTTKEELWQVMEDVTDPSAPFNKWVIRTGVPTTRFGDVPPDTAHAKEGDIFWLLGSPIELYQCEITDNSNPSVPVLEWIKKADFSTIHIPQWIWGLEDPPPQSLGEFQDTYIKTDNPVKFWVKEVVDNTDPTNPVVDWVEKIDIELIRRAEGSLLPFNITGDGSTLAFPVVHNLATKNLMCEVYRQSSGETVFLSVKRSDDNTIIIEGDAPLENGEIYVVLVSGQITGATNSQIDAPLSASFNLPSYFAETATDTAAAANGTVMRIGIGPWLLTEIKLMAINPGAGPLINVSHNSTPIMPTNVKVTNTLQSIAVSPGMEIAEDDYFEISTSQDINASGLLVQLIGRMI